MLVPRKVLMAKILLVLTFVLIMTSCNQNPDCSSQTSTVQKAESGQTATCPAPTTETPTPPVTPTTPVPSEDVPTEALIFDTDIEFFNFEKDDEDKVYKAVDVIKKVVASSEFRDKVLNFTYLGQKQFVDNKGMTNAQIYQALLDGKEDLRPEIDHTMNLQLELYYTWTSTVGYTTPGELRIYMNTKFFDPFTVSEVAGNMFHEWTHKLGFDHDVNYSVGRDSSVPYAIGYLIRDLGKQYE
jgi:hypothetical protein